MADTPVARERDEYNTWKKEETRLLLRLMVDATKQGWCINSGSLSKETVEKQFLPSINSIFGCNKNYNNYQSRLRSFRNRWLSYSSLLKFNSAFRYDSTSKMFTAPNEVWDEYLKAHPEGVTLRNKVLEDYEDLQIIIGNTGANNITERTLETNEISDIRIDDLDYDINDEGFVQKDNGSTLGSSEIFKLIKKKLPIKRSRNDHEEGSNLNENTLLPSILEHVTKLGTSLERINDSLQKRENEITTWDAIKEVPDVDDHIRFEAFNLLDCETKKDGFLKMTLEERARWMLYMMGNK
ncbi:uncharacterized protein At2g29880 [Daucus carota subsp. sativus]|uniref:uncharacterized protein At2g29880 n=1 Tax=Daucus carota subsp. sativus TaxID=79200 RepID=UPI0030835977